MPMAPTRLDAGVHSRHILCVVLVHSPRRRLLSMTRRGARLACCACTGEKARHGGIQRRQSMRRSLAAQLHRGWWQGAQCNSCWPARQPSHRTFTAFTAFEREHGVVAPRAALLLLVPCGEKGTHAEGAEKSEAAFLADWARGPQANVQWTRPDARRDGCAANIARPVERSPLSADYVTHERYQMLSIIISLRWRSSSSTLNARCAGARGSEK